MAFKFLQLSSVLLSLVAYVVAGSSLNISSVLTSLLSPEAVVYTPNDTEWFDATDRWSYYGAPSFVVVVEPANEDDVIATLEYATNNDISILAQSGGHGYSMSLEVIQNGIMIHLRKLTSISVDLSTGIVTAGGGSLIGAMVNATYEVGREFSSTVCPCVGLLGATLGGGHGRLQGLHGLTLDSLLSMRVVLANGTAIDVSDSSHPDLFYGMRGAGQNFGIVVSATYESYTLTNSGFSVVAEMLFVNDQLEEVFEYLNKVGSKIPPELAIALWFTPNLEDMLNPFIYVDFVFAGPPSTADIYLDPFKAMGPLQTNETYMPAPDLAYKDTYFQCQKGGYHNSYSLNMVTFDILSIRILYDNYASFVTEYPNAAGMLYYLELWAEQAADQVPANSTAYPWRGRGAVIAELISFYTDANLTDVVDEFLHAQRDLLFATSGYDELIVYQNYAHGNEPLQAIYGYEPWRLEKLEALKKEYDPTNVFGGYQPIPV